MIICRLGGLGGGGVRPVVMQALRRGALVMGHYREGGVGRGKGLVSQGGRARGVGGVGEVRSVGLGSGGKVSGQVLDPSRSLGMTMGGGA